MIDALAQELEKKGYIIKDRKFKDIWDKILSKSEDYRNVMGPGITINPETIVYSGAEYTALPKLPNVTVFSPQRVANNSCGHQHIPLEGDSRPFQEIYEFLNYGAMLLRNARGTTLHLLKPKEKVIVGIRDNMTIYNLSQGSLTTLDMANPKMNSATKELEEKIGPLMQVDYSPGWNGACTTFRINQEYYQRGLLNGDEDNRVIRFLNTRLGKDLYLALPFYTEEFERMGIKLCFGGNIPKELKEEFSPNLFELAVNQNKALLGCLKIPETFDIKTAVKEGIFLDESGLSSGVGG